MAGMTGPYCRHFKVKKKHGMSQNVIGHQVIYNSRHNILCIFFTLIRNPDLDMVKLYLLTEHEIFSCGGSNITV